jgi:lysozyme family protein
MLPLIGLAATLVPELIRLIASDKAGTVATSVAQAVTDIAGTKDPAAARLKLGSDLTAAAALQQRLAEIALDATKAQLAEADQQRQDDLSTLKMHEENTSGARGAMQLLASARSPIAWGAPLVSVVVAVGFFLVLGLLVTSGLRTIDDKTADIINVAIGVLGTGFATVVNFWLGSSSSSRNKDAQVVAMQADHAVQTTDILKTLQHAHDSHNESTRAAFATMQNVVSTAVSGVSAPAERAQPPAAPSPDNFDRCVTVTFAQEGGFSQSASDPGGATNLGITHATLESWRGRPTSVEDVRELTREEAVEIYRSNYWLPARCADLPSGVDLMVFDFGVNSGPRTAVKTLQKAIGVTDDGSVGPKTLAALHNADDHRALINQLSAARLAFCRSLSNYDAFGAGWTNRIGQVKAAALAMV